MKLLALLTASVFLLLAESCTTMGEAAAVLGKEYYNLGNAYFDLKKYDQAARAYQTALSFTPELKIATLNLARTKAETGDAAGALVLLRPLAAADPENLVVAGQLAWLLYKAGELVQAAESWQILAEKLPGDAATQFNAGISLLAADRTEEAQVALERWYALDGKSPAGVLALADLLATKGDPGRAGAVYQAGLDLSAEKNPTRRSLAVGLARMLEAQRRYGDAVAAWKAALELPAAAKDPVQGEGWFRLGRLQLLEIEDYAAGVSALDQAWKAGYQKAQDWRDLLAEPRLTVRAALETDLKASGLTW